MRRLSCSLTSALDLLSEDSGSRHAMHAAGIPQHRTLSSKAHTGSPDCFIRFAAYEVCETRPICRCTATCFC